jgi:aminoglycoside phosphotransferase (APT) family kinase protein
VGVQVDHDVSRPRRYAHVPTGAAPRAIVESVPAAARYYASLVAQRLVHGAPASRRFGTALSLVSRRAPSRRPLEVALRAWPARPNAAVDEVVHAVLQEWPRFAASARALPAAPPDSLAVIAMPRRAGLVVLLVDGTRPLLVVKQPGDEAALEREARALERVRALGIAPRWLGCAGRAHVQEGLRGEALAVQPLSPETAAQAVWTSELDQTANALGRLAEATAAEGIAAWIDNAARLDGGVSLPARPRARIAAALADIHDDRRVVLEHGDPSPQNFLFEHGRLTGAIDWEFARDGGLPGSDVLDAVMGAFLHGVALTTWSPDAIARAFDGAWSGSALFERGREAARTVIRAAGVPESRLDAYEVGYFAARTGARLGGTNLSALHVQTELRMLQTVCAG